MYKYITVINSKVESFIHEDIDTLLSIVTTFYDKLNINYNRDDILKQIQRQSKNEKLETKKISIGDAFNGAKAILRLTVGNSCSPEEIIRRSKICETCPLSSKTSKCAACGAAKKITLAINLIRKLKKNAIEIPSEIKSNYCGVCECALATMVVTRYNDFYLEPKEKNQKRPQFCWLNRISPNFTKE